MTSMRTRLRRHIATLAEVSEASIDDQTPILEDGYLDSANLLELIYLIEEMTDTELDLDEIQPEIFRNIDTICTHFGEQGS